MGAVNTTYTFTATDTITSTKMNNIIDQTTITDDAIIGTTLEVASGQLKVRALGITSNEIANGQVTSDKIADGTIVNADINASAAIAGTKVSPNFGSQNIVTTGTSTATTFIGNVTGNVSGSSGSCTGNSATVTNGVYTNASNVLTGSLSFNNSGTNTISNGTGDNATLSTYNLAIKSHWGIGFPSYDNINRIVFDTRNGGAQFSGTVTAPTFSGNATTASTATTVSNGAITAAKLDGAQSGDAPIFGVRAWVNFNGTSGSTAIRQAGNVSSVTRNALGRYTITFSTAMQDTNYAIVGFARDADNSGGNYFVSALSGDTKTTTQVQIEVNSTGGTVDSPEINLMIVR